MTAVRPRPCSECPYKTGTPSGIWSHEDYEKLRLYDEETFAQPTLGFSCHSNADEYCYGWAVVHSNRGHEHELLALRINWPDAGIPHNTIDLFASGNDAADHGQADIERPTPEAVHAIDRLVRRYRRIQR